PFELDVSLDPKRASAVDQREDRVSESERVRHAQRGACELNEKLRRVTVQQPCNALAGPTKILDGADAVPSDAVRAGGKNPARKRAQPAAVAMDRNRSARVIDSENSIVEEHAAADQDAGQNPDHERRVRSNERAGS